MARTEQSYRGPMVLLKFHHKPVIVIPRDFLLPIVRRDLGDITTKSATDYGPGQESFVYNIKDTACVPVFLADWIQSMDVSKSLSFVMDNVTEEHFLPAAEVGDPEGVPEILRRFHNIFQHFSYDTTYTSDICDSMVDWYIDHLRNNSNNLDNLFLTCRRNDKTEEGGLVRVCANVLEHHGETLFTPENQEDFGYWLHAHTSEGEGHIPGDIMDPAFAHHCAYHRHGDDEICYKLKIQQPRGLPLR